MQEDRENLFGRVFCLLSLIKSEKLLEKGATNPLLILHVTKEFIRLSKVKTFVHKVALAGLCELCRQVGVCFAYIFIQAHCAQLFCPEFVTKIRQYQVISISGTDKFLPH